MIQAKIIADSVSTAGVRITTLELQYPRFIHGEVMTHRVFSRNAMSSRAIPVAKMVEQVRSNPATPVHWGKNQPGMQANEQLTGAALESAKCLWLRAAQQAADLAERMVDLGLHKQATNRILEPFQWMRTLITSTEWDNFFELRAHPDAQPEFHELALQMQAAMGGSKSVLRSSGSDVDSWHLPYVLDSERYLYRPSILLKLSTARCARVSYLTHEGDRPDINKDIALYDRLVGSRPIHASPAEHQARAMSVGATKCRNFRGWTQHRQLLEEKLPC